MKQALEASAASAGLLTKSAARKKNPYAVINRIAIEELEAWFFGDVEALAAAYPRVPRSLGAKRAYRNSDAIKGGTWEALERVLQQAGYYTCGLPKIEVAQNISVRMNPEQNRSRSFQVFRDALAGMA